MEAEGRNMRSSIITPDTPVIFLWLEVHLLENGLCVCLCARARAHVCVCVCLSVRMRKMRISRGTSSSFRPVYAICISAILQVERRQEVQLEHKHTHTHTKQSPLWSIVVGFWWCLSSNPMRSPEPRFNWKFNYFDSVLFTLVWE